MTANHTYQPTRRAFEKYKSIVLEPATATIAAHLIAPVANLVVDYLGLPRTREDHFSFLVSRFDIRHSHKLTSFEEYTICICPSKQFTGIIISVGFSSTRMDHWYIKRIVDPPVQSALGSANMFDIPIALISRITIAASWSGTCTIAHMPCNCVREHVNTCADEIVAGLHKAYFDKAERVNQSYLRAI